MKNFFWLHIALIALVALVLWWQTPGTSIASPLANITPPATADVPLAASVPAIPLVPTTINLTERVATPMQQQFAAVASFYADELAFPPYSRPLTKADFQLLHPNHYAVQPIPLQGGASAAIVLSQYRFIYPETITASLELTGLQVSHVELRLLAEDTGKLLAKQAMLANDKGYHADLSASKDWQGPLKLEVSFRVNGQQQLLHTGIDYQQPTAFVTGVADGYAASTDLVIPVKLQVEQAGTYRIRANLFSEKGMPLAHLVSSARLNSGDATLPLRAYKAVLAGIEGPYVLKSVIIELRSPAPGEPNRYGRSEQAEYPVVFYGLSQLSDEPWQPDDSEVLRLQFLNQLAAGK